MVPPSELEKKMGKMKNSGWLTVNLDLGEEVEESSEDDELVDGDLKNVRRQQN